MGKYDNYDNAKGIKRAQKKLDKLLAKRKPDLYAIDLAQQALVTAKLFESCQIFGREDFWKNSYAPNALIMFSDDNEVILFGDKLIPYKELTSFKFFETSKTVSHTTTKTKGTVPRAIVGGVLAGGVGAVVGALSAGSKSETNSYSVFTGFLLQVFLKNGNGYQLPVPCRDKKWTELMGKLQTIIDANAT